jgi:hypothetical protein
LVPPVIKAEVIFVNFANVSIMPMHWAANSRVGSKINALVRPLGR